MPNIDLTQWDLLTEEKFDSMLFDSGVFVANFDPTSMAIPDENDILFTTGGDITINHKLTQANLGDGVNNIHFPYAELMIVTGTDTASISVSSFDFSLDMLKLALGTATITVADDKVEPKYSIAASDFIQNFAWVGCKKGGGLVAVVIPMALSTGGLSITAKKGDKGTSQLTIGAFRSINDKTKAEMTFYSTTPTAIKITAQPESKSVVAGTATSFSVTASGASSLSYQWQVRSKSDAVYSNISGETSSTLALGTSDVTVDANGDKYRCKITMGTDVTYSNSATLSVSAGV